MAGIAFQGGDEMVGGLAGGTDAIVADGTFLGGGVVGETRGHPGQGAVAIVAGGAGNRNVPGRQTLRGGVIVAACAFTQHRRVVHGGIEERRGHMAVIAFIAGRDMTAGFAFGDRAVVAAITFLRRAAEDAFEMATFTLRGFMFAGEQEAGSEVIKLVGGIERGRDGATRCAQQQHKSEDNARC